MGTPTAIEIGRRIAGEAPDWSDRTGVVLAGMAHGVGAGAKFAAVCDVIREDVAVQFAALWQGHFHTSYQDIDGPNPNRRVLDGTYADEVNAYTAAMAADGGKYWPCTTPGCEVAEVAEDRYPDIHRRFPEFATIKEFENRCLGCDGPCAPQQAGACDCDCHTMSREDWIAREEERVIDAG